MSLTTPDSIPSPAQHPVLQWIPRRNHRRSGPVILVEYLDSGKTIDRSRLQPLESPVDLRNAREVLSGQQNMAGEWKVYFLNFSFELFVLSKKSKQWKNIKRRQFITWFYRSHRPSEVRPKSPEKFRDYTSPTRKPAAGKPSRPEERPIAPRKPDKESGPTKPTEKKPAPEPKSNRFTDRFEKPKKPEQDKPKRGDQSPDSLDEDVVYPKSMPVPEILSKIPLKEQCICELCTCGWVFLAVEYYTNR